MPLPRDVFTVAAVTAGMSSGNHDRLIMPLPRGSGCPDPPTRPRYQAEKGLPTWINRTIAMATSMSSSSPRSTHMDVETTSLDVALEAQLAVAWAGEFGEEPRLGWWRTDLVSEFGGEDLFQRLMPNTCSWAVLQGAREAARRKDAELRRQDANPDRIISLFCFGFEVDERVEERLLDLKRSGKHPNAALPGLKDFLTTVWRPERFVDWVQSHGSARLGPSSVGRRIEGAPPEALSDRVKVLVAALAPLSDAYPLPHFRRKV